VRAAAPVDPGGSIDFKPLPSFLTDGHLPADQLDAAKGEHLRALQDTLVVLHHNPLRDLQLEWEERFSALISQLTSLPSLSSTPQRGFAHFRSRAIRRRRCCLRFGRPTGSPTAQ
jgi:hypothetical protein